MMPINGWDILDPDDIQNPEFELGGMQFRIKKLLPFEAKKVLYRYVFPMFQSTEGINERMTPPAVMMKVLTSADPDVLDRLSEIFMRHCIYFRNDAGQFVKMLTDPEAASQSLLPVELMLLDVRAFAVNFGESVSKVVEELESRAAQMEADSLTSPSEPTHSSTPVSQPASIPSRISRPARKKATQK